MVPFHLAVSSCPKLDYTLANPTQELFGLARDVGMEGRIHVVTCGDVTSGQNLTQVLKECMSAGYWLVLQNAHLGQPWPQDSVQLIKVILYWTLRLLLPVHGAGFQ